MKKCLLATLVFVSFFLSGCETLNGAWHDARATKDAVLGALRTRSVAPPPVSLKGVPVQERSGVLRAVAACESQYAPPPKYYPPRGDVSMNGAIARHQYESCLQEKLDEAMPLDAKYRKQVRSSCINLGGVLLENCMEGVRVSHLSRKARDVADRRDRISQIRSAVVRDLK